MKSFLLAVLVLVVSEARLKTEVLQTAQTHKTLDRARKLSDPTRRAWALAPLVSSRFSQASEAALGELPKSGRAALPVFRALLKGGLRPPHFSVPYIVDMTLADLTEDTITAMRKAVGHGAILDLKNLVKSEVTYWHEQAPHLQKGWSGDNNLSPDDARPKIEAESRLLHFGRLQAALKALATMGAPQARGAVEQVRPLWQKSPVLSEGNDLAALCDRILKGPKD